MDTEGTNTGWAGAHRGFQTRSAAAWMDGGPQHPPRPALGWWRCRAHPRRGTRARLGAVSEYQLPHVGGLRRLAGPHRQIAQSRSVGPTRRWSISMDFDGPRLLELLGSPAEVRRHYCASCSWRTAPYMHDSSLTVVIGG